MSAEVIGLLLFVGGIPVWYLLAWLRAPWRLASLAIPAGVLGGGLLSSMLAFLPWWGELAILIWLAGSMYGMLLLIGYRNRPFWDEHGWRW